MSYKKLIKQFIKFIEIFIYKIQSNKVDAINEWRNFKNILIKQDFNIDVAKNYIKELENKVT